MRERGQGPRQDAPCPPLLPHTSLPPAEGALNSLSLPLHSASPARGEDREGTGRRRHGHQPQLLPVPARHHLLPQDGKRGPSGPTPGPASLFQAAPPASVCKDASRPQDVFPASGLLLSNLTLGWRRRSPTPTPAQGLWESHRLWGLCHNPSALKPQLGAQTPLLQPRDPTPQL